MISAKQTAGLVHVHLLKPSGFVGHVEIVPGLYMHFYKMQVYTKHYNIYYVKY